MEFCPSLTRAKTLACFHRFEIYLMRYKLQTSGRLTEVAEKQGHRANAFLTVQPNPICDTSQASLRISTLTFLPPSFATVPKGEIKQMTYIYAPPIAVSSQRQYLRKSEQALAVFQCVATSVDQGPL